ncbi:MAG: DUF4832 domain-containing protein [Chitinophagaceae bacterium]
MKTNIVLAGLSFLLVYCGKKQNVVAQVTPVSISYARSTADFPNPERGFYRFSSTKASQPVALRRDQLDEWKKETLAEGGNYKVFSTLIFRYYELDIFKDQSLTPAFLATVTNDFKTVREAGFKMIPRFTYTLTQKAGNCPEGFICPPYGDAPKTIVLQHIAELKSVLQANADVIAAVQMGFIGVWGEQYYTDYFGDASQNTTTQKLTDANWQDRIDVLRALLDAVPKDRMIQVRYPQIKQRYVYGIKAGVNAAAMTPEEAFSETDKARIGYHNDCFMASTNDYGTYEDYGNSSSPRQDANTVLREFKRNDSRYVVVGGETCSDDYSPQNDCEPNGRVQTEMRELHYSFLNCAYNNKVNDDWQTGGCMDNIRKNLGYRFVLKTGSFPPAAKSGSAINFKLEIENEGYASPYNKRPVILVLRNKADGQEQKIELATDVRKWYTGSVSLNPEVTIPADVKKGSYDLFLFLPDQSASISSRPEYAIRLANDKVWEPVTGYNKLNTVLEVE